MGQRPARYSSSSSLQALRAFSVSVAGRKFGNVFQGAGVRFFGEVNDIDFFALLFKFRDGPFHGWLCIIGNHCKTVCVPEINPI